MKIKLNDGTELNVLAVNGKSVFMQGLNRDSLEFVFKKGDYAFDELDTLFADKDKVKKIIVQEPVLDETVAPAEYLYEDYSLRYSMRMEPVVITPETSTQPEVVEERIMVTMAQLSLIERKLQDLGLL